MLELLTRKAGHIYCSGMITLMDSRSEWFIFVHHLRTHCMNHPIPPLFGEGREHTLMPDISTLIYALHTFHPISKEAEDHLRKYITPVSIAKKKLLLKEGAYCDHVYFIKKGAVRGFFKEA